MSYAAPNVQTLADIAAMAPDSQQDLVSAYFHKKSGQHNALQRFTSTFDPAQRNGGISSIFAQKTELAAGASSRIHFTTVGLPAGPGVTGAATLTGNESESSFGNYSVAVDWIRDAVTLTKDQVERLGPGKDLKKVLMALLGEKMGIVKQHQMLRRLIDFSYNLSTPGNWAAGVSRGNVYRVGNRANVHQLTPDDVLSVEVSNIARERLTTLGAEPLMRNMQGKAGSPVDNYLIFGTTNSFLPLRNSSLFSTAKDADTRGEGNANFTGKLLDYQGNSFYELPVKDIAWDDFKGGPLVAKAVVTVAAAPATVGGPKLIVNSANLKSLYFQWFDGYRQPYAEYRLGSSAPDLSTNEYYGWACNPDGSRVFFAYAGNQAGNQITITKILSPAVGATTIDQTTVGQLTCGTAALSGDNFSGGGDTNLPATNSNGNWVYSNTIDAGAVILQANSQGTTYTRSFCFGAMAAMFANGRVDMQRTEQEFDFGFVKGMGIDMVFGTGVTLDPLGVPSGYLVIEHAYSIPGYPCPALEA